MTAPKTPAASLPVSVLVDARPLRAPLSGVGQYVRQLSTVLSRRDDVRLGLLEFDFLGRHAEFRAGLGIDRDRVTTRPHRLVHRKAFNAVGAYTPLPLGGLFGLGGHDVVHETYFERLPELRRSARRRPPARVATIHDVGFLRHPEMFDAVNLAASRRAFRSQVDRCQLLLVPSRFTRSELVELAHVDPHRVLVTPLAATAGAPASAAAPAADPARSARPYALYVGNIDPRKNVAGLVDAWVRDGLGREFDLVLVGAPMPGSEPLAERIAGLQGAGVHYRGYVPDAERDALLAGAACFVYPSSYEGFGLPVLEAMAAGTPVVVSDAPALVELTGDAALHVDRATLDGLGEAIGRVLRDPDLRAGLVERGRRRAAAYSWAATAATTLDGYRRALALRG